MRPRRCFFAFSGRLAGNRSAQIFSCLLTLFLLAPFAVAQAAPTVIEESFRLAGPGDSSYFGVIDLALDGNRLAVITQPQSRNINAWVYERSPNSENQWSGPQAVFQASSPDPIHMPRLALQGNILALAFQDRVIIAERLSSGWNVTANLTPPPGIAHMGSDVEIDNGTIVVGAATGNYQAVIYRKNSNGAWSYSGHVTGGPWQPNGAEFFGGDVDISGNTIVLGCPYHTLPAGTPSGSVFVFTNTGGSWAQNAQLRYPLSGEEPPNWAGHVAMEADKLIVSFGYVRPESYFYQRTNGVWDFASAYHPTPVFFGGQDIPAAISGNLIAKQLGDPVRGGGRVLLYSPQGSQLVPVADLKHAQYTAHDFARIDLSGRTVAASGNDTILIFDIPSDLSQPSIVQDNFQDGNANGWQPFPLSSWTVASSGAARVYRQSQLASEARSVLGGSDWTQQSVSALITPRAFDGSDRWFGLATRFTDASNYYYVTLRSSNTIMLRRMVDGVFTTLASAPLTATPGQTYNVRLEAVGTRLRVYVNHQLRLEAIDSSLRHGQAALLTYRTQADFDNVLLTPNSLTPLFADDFYYGETTLWNKTGDGTWVDPPEAPREPDLPDPYAEQRNLSQTSTVGGARAHTGVATADQVFQVRARPNTLTPTGWFGAMARYVDDGNYYYLKVGAAGEASIRKLVNGAIFELAKVPFAVTPNTWYTLRLEATGNQLRAYINDRFLLEATDTSHATGKYGLVTYRAAATFDEVRVLEP
ncbi:hypothetical protein [Peristeroidobacter agariperforans]|uniref:hypothetical protein n=1 Tax=Peristeroidobacter agariperforans TaxID=268404 RepID=UPI00101CB06D|nr:hypothetical protein [Peristeroidobacter agariperforans]